MIFDSLGIGELGVVVALVVVLVKPKELGKVMREFGKFKRKVSQIQSDVKSQLESITLEAEASEKRDKVQEDKTGMRKWAKEQIQAVPSAARAEAASALALKVAEWPTYKNAKVVACFSGTLEEIDTEPLLRRILADGKTLLMPYVKDGDGEPKIRILGMAPVSDLEKDLEEGAFGILEPRAGLRTGTAPEPDLALIPGLCFDNRGGRLGKGLGFYDRYLTGNRAMRAGLGFDVQITQKNLTLDPHDQLMDAVLSEKRILVFSAPALTAGLAPATSPEPL
ncbi:MAG: 5-formyltetrahydrofolate cyclo-ligase [Fibrobacteres bacterium]|nr:5-formyltetrahydrofolate cyclo-ligase [Fibrobacterota bacterium]